MGYAIACCCARVRVAVAARDTVARSLAAAAALGFTIDYYAEARASHVHRWRGRRLAKNMNAARCAANLAAGVCHQTEIRTGRARKPGRAARLREPLLHSC
jgi:hypothetical protein